MRLSKFNYCKDEVAPNTNRQQTLNSLRRYLLELADAFPL